MDSVFLRRWQAWRRRSAPVMRYRQGARGHPLYSAQSGIDHLRTDVVSTVIARFENRGWDFEARIRAALEDITGLETELKTVPREVEVEDEVGYLDETRALLEFLRSSLDGDLESAE